MNSRLTSGTENIIMIMRSFPQSLTFRGNMFPSCDSLDLDYIRYILCAH